METAQMVLIGLGALALIVFVVKFGKALLILALVAGVVVIVIALALAALGSAPLPIATTFDTIDDVGRTVENVRQTTDSIERTANSVEQTAANVKQAARRVFYNLVFGILALAFLAALVAIGWLVIRLKLATRGVGALRGWKRQSGPRQVEYRPVVYIVQPGETDRWERLEQVHPAIYTEIESEVDKWIDDNYFQS